MNSKNSKESSKSFKSSTTSKEVENPEEVKNQEKEGERVEIRFPNLTSVLNLENKSFFERMSSKAREIANRLYEGVYKIPVVNRIVGKLEIAYNQFWIDRHQEKATQLREKIDGVDLQLAALEQSKKEIESAVDDLKKQNIFGAAESLQIKLQDIDRERMALLNKKDKFLTKFEARDNKLKLYTNERDRIADKLIARYEEKLKPMEAELERLQTFNDQLDLLIAVTEAKHNQQLTKLNDIEKKKIQIEETLRKTGMSERKIRNFEAIKQLEKIVADGREKIKTEKEILARRKAEINKKIARVDAKANPYRDKREEFVRIKKGRPVKFEVAARQREEVFVGEEEIKVHRRVEAVDEKRLKIAIFLAEWNTLVKERYKNAGKNIDVKDFLKETGLSKTDELDFEDFKNILSRYYKFKKLPMEQYNQSIEQYNQNMDEFFKKENKN